MLPLRDSDALKCSKKHSHLGVYVCMYVCMCVNIYIVLMSPSNRYHRYLRREKERHGACSIRDILRVLARGKLHFVRFCKNWSST